jgi:hypothetical protein
MFNRVGDASGKFRSMGQPCREVVFLPAKTLIDSECFVAIDQKCRC